MGESLVSAETSNTKHCIKVKTGETDLYKGSIRSFEPALLFFTQAVSLIV